MPEPDEVNPSLREPGIEPQPITPPGSSADEPRAAYIHVPFCAHRCGYCNFTVTAGRDDLIGPFLDALARELALLQRPREVDTIFVGGGTPTFLSPDKLETLLALVNRWFPLSPGGEFSVEANPEHFDRDRAELLTASGVNRVSLGAQSFQSEKLRRLERAHSAQDIEQSVSLARTLGAAVSLDLIFAAPEETLAAWQNDLTQALALPVDHLSTYGLTFERGTTFWSRRLRGSITTIDEETERAMYAAAIDRITAAGLEHYEISNFALPGKRCRHNQVYWQAKEYYAAGPGAARYVAGRREVNHRSTTTWIKRLAAGVSPVAESETLSHEDRAREALMLGLRQIEGVEIASFIARWQLSPGELFGPRELRHLLEQGLLQEQAGRLCLTREGLFVSDSIWPQLLHC